MLMNEYDPLGTCNLIWPCVFFIADKTWMHTPEALSKHYIPYNAKVKWLIWYLFKLFCYVILIKFMIDLRKIVYALAFPSRWFLKKVCIRKFVIYSMRSGFFHQISNSFFFPVTPIKQLFYLIIKSILYNCSLSCMYSLQII